MIAEYLLVGVEADAAFASREAENQRDNQGDDQVENNQREEDFVQRDPDALTGVTFLALPWLATLAFLGSGALTCLVANLWLRARDHTDDKSGAA